MGQPSLSKNPARPRSLFIVVLLAAAVAGCGGSPTQSSPPVDQFPNGPKITCPDMPAPITSPTGQAVSVAYGTATSAGGAPSVLVSCAPPSGSTFPIGTNSVVCTATDGRQRTDSCSFNVVVQQPPKLKLTNIVAFGDSITLGEDGRASLAAYGVHGQFGPAVLFPFSLTYPGALQQLLRTRYTTQSPTVSNSGFPGEKAGSADALSRFLSVIANRNYEVVLLMEGTNDIYERDSGEIPAAAAGLRRMVQAAKGRGLEVFISTIPPMVPGAPRGLAWSLVSPMNEQIRQVASSQGATLVDINDAFGTAFDQYLGPDGLHPNEAGYAKIADTFFAALKSELEIKSTTTSAPLFRPSLVRPRR